MKTLNLERKDWVLIQRYVTGIATVDESHRIEQWMSRNPENEKLIRDLEEIWNLTPEEDFDIDVQQAWNQFRLRKKKGARILQLHTAPEKKSYAIYHVFRAAAFILVAVVAGFFFQHISTVQSEAELALDRSQFNTLQELMTDRGEKARVTFSDGTEVTLNSSSSITFPDQFHGQSREVHLNGEAYFNVVHNPDAPFLVHAQHTKIEVLGTEFNVRGWNEDQVVDILVRDGKVSISTAEEVNRKVGNSDVILEAGQFTRVIKGQGLEQVRNVDPVNHLLWMSGGMYFDNVPFKQVIKDIERRFDVEISIIDSELKEVPYTGTFQYAELNEVLAVIAASMEVGYSRDSTKIEFQ